MTWQLREPLLFFPFSSQTSLKSNSTHKKNISKPLKMFSDCVIRGMDADVNPSGRKTFANVKMQIAYRLWLAWKQRRVEAEIRSTAWERAEWLQAHVSQWAAAGFARWDFSHRPWRPKERLIETCRVASCVSRVSGGALSAELMALVSLISQLITSGHRVLMKESPH